MLRAARFRIAILEATTGGLISSSLLSVPGASSFFISCAVVYTGRGAKRILPEEVIKASSLFEREKNYSNKESYILSKLKYCEVVSKALRNSMKADIAFVESGTSGPDFYIPGVENGFTVIGISGPKEFTSIKKVETNSKDRIKNMKIFCDFGLECLKSALEEIKMSNSIL